MDGWSMKQLPRLKGLPLMPNLSSNAIAGLSGLKSGVPTSSQGSPILTSTRVLTEYAAMLVRLYMCSVFLSRSAGEICPVLHLELVTRK
ncbi:hypothetical protein ACHAXT_000800 [Thalassiosira profunda]